MSLQEELEELKKLKTAEDAEAIEEEEDETEEDDEDDETETEEEETDDGTSETPDSGEDEGEQDDGDEQPEEKPEGKVDKNQKTKPEEEPDARGHARLRREKAAAEKRAKELEERLERLERQGQETHPSKAVEKEEVTPPDPKEDPIAWLEWKEARTQAKIDKLQEHISKDDEQRQDEDMRARAAQELTSIEDQFKNTVEDYDDVSAFVVDQIARSIRTLNPMVTDQQLGAMVQNQILVNASQYANQGLNPIEEMYHTAKEVHGYKPKGKAGEKPKRDMGKVAQNRKRNAGTASAPSSSGAPSVTREVAGEMSTAEFSRLPKAEKDRLLAGE